MSTDSQVCHPIPEPPKILVLTLTLTPMLVQTQMATAQG
jgi:hypothetical protein